MTLLTVLVFILVAGYILERVLDYLNSKNWSEKLPNELAGIYDADAYQKAQQYDKANKNLSLISDTFSMLFMLIMLCTGAFGKLDDWAISITNSPVTATLLFFGVVAVASEILGMPFSMYKTFVIEEKFGFNKITPRLFIFDKIKGYVLGIILLGGLIVLFSYLYNAFTDHFWLYAWGIAAVFMVLMAAFYTSLLLPIFNKLKPLTEGPLKDAILSYCKKTGFGLSDVYVMDGSKRSSKSNAFFSGLGSRKKIVLFDTLIEKHTESELVAVLAHETGHYKLRHIQSGMILSVVQLGILLFLFSLFMESTALTGAMGGTHHTIELGLLAFGILYSPISILVGLLVNYLSRKHEFEADRYAAETYERGALQSALKKLSLNNLSNLNPHPAYVFFYYSHPPLMQRLRALEQVNQTA